MSSFLSSQTGPNSDYRRIILQPLPTLEPRTNKQVWFALAKSYLQAEDVWWVLEEDFSREKPAPSVQDSEHARSWKVANAKIVYDLMICLTDSDKSKFVGLNAKELWIQLRLKYAS
jgi:hypothetical protein